MPSDLQASRGQIDFRSSKTGMICLQWVDKRPVTMLSTAHTSKVVTLPPNRRGVERSKPEVVVAYNNGMKGVDLSDQLAQSYPTTRKTVKWYKKIFFYLLDMTTTNALAIHRALGGKLTQFEFRKELVRGLLQQGGPRGSFRRNPPQARHEEEVLQQAHLPVDTPHQAQTTNSINTVGYEHSSPKVPSMWKKFHENHFLLTNSASVWRQCVLGIAYSIKLASKKDWCLGDAQSGISEAEVASVLINFLEIQYKHLLVFIFPHYVAFFELSMVD
ncbi:uncharacterized protein LOC119571566 [Penaeus monodon]|uniref:uncharacterized protein LOC119571566 n=1 Tax=Penaeus monodon TaxID=6687 RepID=UPI0018A737B9|nr:uncharacterized protein LOC119571566 [Penaeus monodon]